MTSSERDDINGEGYRIYVEEVLASKSSADDIVIVDAFGSHKRVHDAAEARGASCCSYPPIRPA